MYQWERERRVRGVMIHGHKDNFLLDDGKYEGNNRHVSTPLPSSFVPPLWYVRFPGCIRYGMTKVFVEHTLQSLPVRITSRSRDPCVPRTETPSPKTKVEV